MAAGGKARVESRRKAAEPKVGSKTQKTEIKKRLRALDRELTSIEEELCSDSKSVMFGGAGAGGDLKLVQMEDRGDPKEGMRRFYKKMALKCMKCNSSFDHEATLLKIEHELTCPGCGEQHILEFRPSSRFFTVHSKTVDVLGGE